MPESLEVFAHLNAEKKENYRSILAIFVKSREEFIIHLRPSEILLELESLRAVLFPQGSEFLRC